jgi:hypothetical protein
MVRTIMRVCLSTGPIYASGFSALFPHFLIGRDFFCVVSFFALGEDLCPDPESKHGKLRPETDGNNSPDVNKWGGAGH